MTTIDPTAVDSISPAPATSTSRLAPILRLGLILLVILTIPIGCGEVQVARVNRELMLRLATATSSRNQENLERIAKEVDEGLRDGRISEAEADTFSAIIDLARDGRWDEARDRAYALRDAQQPTEEDKQRVRDRVLPEPKDPPGRR